ncbi:MAG: branched-chain amino acid ABC transporter permease [Chloroflexi bacterium]|nr:branched-chain amino acid ABC transporter permease [Chloroflexota bacterium]MCI0577931.1 branched-chain amino acid ABC transporter permease [Chloroflexota bacterium]MCI0645811.1 branched-chain amino acid ABC transporter permease [Chloroflexota bacterium]MCI0727280.1 branched-chain amino acid ABC transporter permease [Chloroflexota bacterium]
MAVLRPAGDFDRTYQQDMAIVRQRWQWLVLAAAVAVLLTAPRWASAYVVSTANQIAYTVIAVQGLNILTGYTGQISLGQAAFMLVGGYISALLVTRAGFSTFAALPFAALGTGLIGLIFGLPSLRVKGFYLAMATLAAQFIIPWLSRHTFKDYLGGSSGGIDAPVPVIGNFSFGEVSDYIYISLAVLTLTTLLALNISRTRLGRAFISVRDNDLAAELLGVNPFGYKLRAFFIAALLAGVAGALKAHSQRGVGTEFGYGLGDSILFLGMLVIGGLGTNIGPFLGVTTVILLEDLANAFGGYLATVFPGQSASLLTSFRPIFFGLVLMLFLIFEPRGLAHRWQLFKAAWRLRPFSR